MSVLELSNKIPQHEEKKQRSTKKKGAEIKKSLNVLFPSEDEETIHKEMSAKS